MSDGRITEHERAQVVQLLGRTRDDFLAAVESVTDDQWCFRPAPDGWSIGLIAEHLGLVERGLFGRVEQALRGATHPEWQTATGGKDALIETMLADRHTRKDAPDAVVPTGAVARHDALQIFQERRLGHSPLPRRPPPRFGRIRSTIIARQSEPSTPTSGCSTSHCITSGTFGKFRRSKP